MRIVKFIHNDSGKEVFRTQRDNFGGRTNTKVEFIKALRSASGLGLKEAKETADDVQYKGAGESQIYDDADIHELKRVCDSNSIQIIDPVSSGEEIKNYEKQLRTMAAEAILAGDDCIAGDLMNILRKYGAA